MSKVKRKKTGSALLLIFFIGVGLAMSMASCSASSSMEDAAINTFGGKTKSIAWQDDKYEWEKRYLSHEVAEKQCMEGRFGPGWIQVVVSFEWRRKEFTSDAWTEWNKGYALYLVEIHEYQAPVVVKKIDVFDNVTPVPLSISPPAPFECFPYTQQ